MCQLADFETQFMAARCRGGVWGTDGGRDS